MKKMEQYRHSKDMEVTIRIKSRKKKKKRKEKRKAIWKKKLCFFKKSNNHNKIPQ